VSDELDEVLARLWDSHSPAALERLEVVRQAVRSLGDGIAAADDAVSAAHNLAGSLGMYGFGAGSKVALRAEAALRAGPGRGDVDLEELQRDLTQVVEQVSSGRRDPK
jgi:HPt (histidine-containing phosphotransfer) domain-containing protein